MVHFNDLTLKLFSYILFAVTRFYTHILYQVICGRNQIVRSVGLIWYILLGQPLKSDIFNFLIIFILSSESATYTVLWGSNSSDTLGIGCVE